MQIQIEKGYDIGMQLNQIEDLLKEAIKNDSKIQQKLQEFENIIEEKKEVPTCVFKKIAHSTLLESLPQKMINHRKEIGKEKEEIEQQKISKVKEIQSISYDYTLEKFKQSIEVLEDILQDQKHKYQEQIGIQINIEQEKKKQQGDIISKYIQLSETNNQERQMISKLQYELKKAEDERLKQNNEKCKQIYQEERIRIQQEKEQEEQLEQQLQQQQENDIKELELKKIDIEPKLKVQFQLLLKEENYLKNSQEILLSIQKEELSINKIFKILTNILIVLLIILISKFILPANFLKFY